MLGPVATLTALDAARFLAAALDLRWGELTLSVADGEPTILRRGETLKPEDLAQMEVPGPLSSG